MIQAVEQHTTRHDPVIPLIAAKRRYEAAMASETATSRELIAAACAAARFERLLLRRQAITIPGACVSLELLLETLPDYGDDMGVQLMRSLATGALNVLQAQ